MNLLKRIKNFRFKTNATSKVLGINRRNLDYIYPNNQRKYFPVADDKLLTKQVLGEAGIKFPETYASYNHFYQLKSLVNDIGNRDKFVIKPAQGKAGGGIIVVNDRYGSHWSGSNGKVYQLDELRKHAADIIFGVYSFSNMNDKVIIESLVNQHRAIEQISPYGLADIRIILLNNIPVMAMLRVPSFDSDGKANLHQGAYGVGINLKNGQTQTIIKQNRLQTSLPQAHAGLHNMTLPFWPEVLEMSLLAADVVPLNYLGLDIVLTDDGPMMLEINARPGIEIQNANLNGLRHLLEAAGGVEQ